jgi:hypothetical protein
MQHIFLHLNEDMLSWATQSTLKTSELVIINNYDTQFVK